MVRFWKYFEMISCGARERAGSNMIWFLASASWAELPLPEMEKVGEEAWGKMRSSDLNVGSSRCLFSPRAGARQDADAWNSRTGEGWR